MIFSDGFPCTYLSHQPYFRMHCHGAYIKFKYFPCAPTETPYFIHPVLPSTPYCPYSAPYPRLMSHLLVTLLLFSRCVYFAVCNCIRTDLKYPRRVLHLNAVMARPALHRILRSLFVEHQSAESEDLGFDCS